MQLKNFISVKFPGSDDTLYAEVTRTSPDGNFDCRFVHTGSQYTFRKTNSQLEVVRSTGMYKAGTRTTEANFFERTDQWTEFPGGFAAVTFSDGISYLGIVESYTPEFKLKFLHSGNVYTFDSAGVAHSNNGKYDGHPTTAILPYSMLFISDSPASTPPPVSVPGSESELSIALSHIQNFRKPAPSAWPSLNRSIVADGLSQLVNDPDSIQQASLSLCGPAAFITIYAKYNPIDFVLFAAGLFNDGTGSINNLLFQPNEDLRNGDYTLIRRNDPNTPPQADWMILSTLADENNNMVDFEGTSAEEFAGFTYPKSLKRWLEHVGRFSAVENNTNLVSRMSYKNIIDKSRSGDPIILMINQSMLNKGETRGFPPNHYIVLKSPITLRGSDLEFEYWSWGRTERLTIWSLDFDNSFFGYVMASV